MTDLLQDHRLKDDEQLRVPQSVPHTMQLLHQGYQKVSPDLPSWRVVAPVGNDRKVTPPPLPIIIVPDASTKVSARVGVNPVPIDFLELEVLLGWGVARQISPPPLPILLFQRMVAPALSLRLAGLCSGSSGEVTGRSFPFPFSSCTRPCLPPPYFVRSNLFPSPYPFFI